jgi:hypothetical protein
LLYSVSDTVMPSGKPENLDLCIIRNAACETPPSLG